VLDRQTRNSVESLLDRFERLLARTAVSRKDVIEYIARAESSELNPVFLYVADEYRRTSREGERITGEIQRHLSHIQSFIDDLPRDLRPSVDVSTLPFVGETRFLVLDDRGALRKLLASLLARRGAVDTAGEGHEALERLREHFHDAIVSDLHMPGMDGLEFYRRAVAYDAHLKGRFLFYSADVSPERERCLKDNGICLLRKPFDLPAFGKAIDRILSGGRRVHMRSDDS
jgi:CheY-like chemotaxis protein